MKSQTIVIDKELLESIAETLAEELATKMYYKLILLKYLPEIKEIEHGRVKALKNEEIHEFLKKLTK